MLAEIALSSLRNVQIGQQGTAQLQHHRLFGTLAVSEIARHLRVASEFAGVIADGGQNRVRPEARAILAHPPALFFNASALGSQPHQLGGTAAVRILLGKKAGKMQLPEFHLPCIA